MKTTTRFLGGVILWVLTVTVPAASYAEDSIGLQIQKKFARGAANTVTGWVELPKQLYLRTAEGPIVLGTVQGIVEGVGMTFARTTAGLYEVATFILPVPWNYKPLLEPEYVWQDEGQEQAD